MNDMKLNSSWLVTVLFALATIIHSGVFCFASEDNADIVFENTLHIKHGKRAVEIYRSIVEGKTIGVFLNIANPSDDTVIFDKITQEYHLYSLHYKSARQSLSDNKRDEALNTILVMLADQNRFERLAGECVL